MSRSTMVVALLALFVAGSLRAGDKTYRDLLQSEGIAGVVRCELGELPEKIKRDVPTTSDMVKWSVEQVAALQPHEQTQGAAAQELRTRYGAFLVELAKFSQENHETVRISPQLADAF